MTAIRECLVLLAALSLVGTSVADEVRGRIIQIDPEKKELRLEGRGPARGSVLRLKIGPKTQIFIGGQSATLDDLAPGRRVRVVFEERDGKLVAEVIRSFGLGLAQPQLAPRAETAPRDGEGLGGTLQRVGLADREIVVLGPGREGRQIETTITVPEDATITRGEKKINLDDLKEGESVSVKTVSKAGKLTAVSIRVGSVDARVKPPMPPRRDLIPRLRQALRMADELLRELEERGAPVSDQP